MKKQILFLFFVIFVFPLWAFGIGRSNQAFNDGWLFKRGPFSDDPVLFTKNITTAWKEVIVPHTWNNVDMQTEKNSYYEGEAYYKKTYFPDVNLSDKRIFLRFEGVASVADVYVNSIFAGNHEGGYSAFAIEITNLLKFGEENEILVKVDNKSRPDVIPINHTLFGVYGGIYRPVELIVTEKVNISVTDYASPGVYISQTKVSDKSANVNVKVKVENATNAIRNAQLVTTIYEADGKVKAKLVTPISILPQGRQEFSHDFVIRKPHLWQGLDDPYLYKTVTQIVDGNHIVDEVVQPLGIRHFELKAADGMYLNGKKVPMYGVCRHQDWWQKGSALSNTEHATDMGIIKEIGATTIRLAHYQQAEYIYAKSDSIGFMIWAEIPFVNRVSTKERGNAKQQMTELIRQNYNHPSIYIWGLHNEVYSPSDYTIALTKELNDLAKTEDPNRYTASVSGYNQVDRPANNHADVQGINHYFGWYNGRIGDIEKWVQGAEKEYPNHKVIFSEYGAEANIEHQQEVVTDVGDCCGFEKNYNESFATKFHEIQWGVIAKHPYLIASYIWNTFDFGTPSAAQGGVKARNMKGLVTFDRKVKKDPFYWYKANWSKEPVLYITQRRVVERENEYTPVTVYSNVGTPKLKVNGVAVEAPSIGNTAVHYIFNSVQLKEGANTIEVTCSQNGSEYTDAIVWNYSKDNKVTDDKSAPVENKNEHIGL